MLDVLKAGAGFPTNKHVVSRAFVTSQSQENSPTSEFIGTSRFLPAFVRADNDVTRNVQLFKILK